MQAMLNIGLKAAREAGRFVLQSSDRIKISDAEIKGKHDYVTEVDKAAEEIIINIIKAAFPEHNILGEESGQIESETPSDYLWIIDPIDGTTNFIHQIPHYGISIALQHKGRIEVAIVYDPAKQEEFTAIRGKGASLNGQRIRVSNEKDLSHALMGTGLPFRPDQEASMDKYFEITKNVAKACAGIRRPGAASLDLAYVAAGRFDGFWEFGLQKWDIAAGVLLVIEAGGLVSDPKGGNDFLESGNLICANPKLFKPLLKLVHH